MIPFQKSIGFRLLGIGIILLTIPLLVDSFILVRERYHRTINDAKSYLAEMAKFREIPLSQLHPLSRNLMELFVHYLKLEAHFPEKSTPELNEKLKSLAQAGEFDGVFLLKITPEGRYIVVASGLPEYLGKDYTHFFKSNDLFSQASLEKEFSSNILIDDTTLHPYFIASHAIYSTQEERFVGVVAVVDDLTLKIRDLLQPDTQRYPVHFALLLPSTIVFASTDPSLKLQYFLPLNESSSTLFQDSAPEAARQLLSKPIPIKNNIGFPFFEFLWKGKAQIGYIRRLSQANYALLAYAAKNDVFQAPLINFFNVYTIYGVILVLGGALATLATLRMAKPIQDLSLVMQKIQEGALHLRYQKDPIGFEINLLGDIFNEMVDAVLEQKHVAEEERVKREIFARELRLGREVQHRLLPQHMPEYPGVELAEIYIPAIEVAGDFYDVFVKSKEGSSKLALAIADASGKGVQACFYSLSVRNMLRTYAHAYDDIAKALSATNELLCKDTGDTGMFVTVLAGLYDHQNQQLSYYSCGHNPGYVRRADGTVEMLHISGVAMGVISSKQQVHAHDIQLNVGDAVVFYTDGITEAQNEESQFFGSSRLESCIREKGGGSATELIEEIVNSVSQFVGSASQYDDITLLTMKIVNRDRND